MKYSVNCGSLCLLEVTASVKILKQALGNSLQGKTIKFLRLASLR